MKILKVFGLYTKKEYIAMSRIFRMQGQQEGRLKERQKAAQTIANIQFKLDDSEANYKELKEDFISLKKYKLEILYKEIAELEVLKGRVKSFRKKKKIDSRIAKLRLKILDIDKIGV